MVKARDANGKFSATDNASAQAEQGDGRHRGLMGFFRHWYVKVGIAMVVFAILFGALKKPWLYKPLNVFSIDNALYSLDLVNSWMCPEQDFCSRLNSLRSVLASIMVSMPEGAAKKHASSFQDAFNSFAPSCKFDSYRTSTPNEDLINGAPAKDDSITKGVNRTESWWP